MKLRPPAPSHPVRAALAGAALLLSLAGSGCSDFLEPGAGDRADLAEATRAVDAWVRAHPTGWSLRLESDRSLARPQWSQPCSRNPDSGFVVLRHEAEGTEIDLGFRCPVSAASSLAQLQGALSWVVLQRLPHGISVPGWRIDVLTPSSSVSGGIALSEPSPGRLLLTVDTPLFAVWGHSLAPSCEPPADGPSPEGCYLSREHRVPLSLRLTVPASRTGLD